jgi:hypothetical protein
MVGKFAESEENNGTIFYLHVEKMEQPNLSYINSPVTI